MGDRKQAQVENSLISESILGRFCQRVRQVRWIKSSVLRMWFGTTSSNTEIDVLAGCSLEGQQNVHRDSLAAGTQGRFLLAVSAGVVFYGSLVGLRIRRSGSYRGGYSDHVRLGGQIYLGTYRENSPFSANGSRFHRLLSGLEICGRISLS